MSKNRYINTEFWEDEYIENLNSIDKLLFLYCLTNPQTNIAGAYKISMKRIAFETGIDKDSCEKIINKFKEDDKIAYINGHIVIRNFVKHQQCNNAKVQKGIDTLIEKLPDEVRSYIAYTYPLNNRDRDSNRDINRDSNGNAENPQDVVEDKEDKIQAFNPKTHKGEIKPHHISSFIFSHNIIFSSDAITPGEKIRDIDINTLAWTSAMTEWLNYKRECNSKYTTTGLKKLLNQWSNVSASDLQSAVDNSISQNYKGLFKANKPLDSKKQTGYHLTDEDKNW